jgi:hypothetical protein
MSGLTKRETVGSTPYVYCPACGGGNTAWDRPIMQKDQVTYRSRRCLSCRNIYRIALLVVDKNPTSIRLLSAYHDAVASGGNTESMWPGEE